MFVLESQSRRLLMIERAEKMIQRHEGLRHFVYMCPAGKYTIGYGRNIDPAGGKGISTKEAEYLLQNDLSRICTHLTKAYPIFHDFNEARQTVLISMGYILGVHGLMKFKRMLKALAHRSYETAADELIDSLMAKQLPERSKELAYMLSTGKFY